MTVLNGERYVRRSIESVLSQDARVPGDHVRSSKRSCNTALTAKQECCDSYATASR